MKVIERFLRKVKVNAAGCFEWQRSINRHGYGNYGSTNDAGTNASKAAHRASYQIFRGPIPDGMCVCHECDNRLCVNPAHLFLASQKDNLHDSIKKGRFTRGNRQHKAKLNDRKVREIRERFAAGESTEILSKEYGVHRQNIRTIVHRKTWKHVT